MPNRMRPALAGLVLLSAFAACESGDPVAPPVDTPAPALARLECTVTVATGAMACAQQTPGTGSARGIIVGGQNRYVALEAGGHAYSAADSVYSMAVTLQNLMPQPLGTLDGTTPDSAGVRIFFDTEPFALAGDASATLTLLSPVQRTTIMRASQAFFAYDQIVGPNQTSDPVTWRIHMPPAVTSFRFFVYVQGEVPFPDGVIGVTPAADTMTVGGTVFFVPRVMNAVGDTLPNQIVTWSTSDPDIATVDPQGIVTAVAPGTAVITATQGSLTGSASMVVCPAIGVGGVYVASMPAGASLCLGEGEYTVVPVNTSTADTTALGVTGAGIIPVSGAPTPALAPGGPRLSRAAGPQPDYAFERRLRQRERRDFTGRIPSRAPAPRGPGRPRFAITPGLPAVGALMSLNVQTAQSCSNPDTRTGRVVAVGASVIVVADTMNPAGGFTAADYAAIADSFDANVHQVVTGVFGVPSDRDGNGRAVAFYTRAVNELTPPGSASYVGGFFFARDLYTAVGCPTSNLGEMFYMLVPDPTGAVNGNVRSAGFVRDVTLGTLAHEYEHLINASRRMWVNASWNGQFEETWLDEGLAHVAEELMFYRVSGLTSGTNANLAAIADGGAVQAAFFKYQESNFGRLRQWLLAPQSSGPFQADDDLATRGSAWAFLRYAADRRVGTEASFWNALVNTSNRGLANLQAVLGTDPLPWFRDFAAAMYADDAAGLSPEVEFTQPSWNFRSIYGALDYTGDGGADGYPLAARNPSNGVTDSVTLLPGGAAAYLRMGVPSSGFAGVTVRRAGVAPGAHIRLAVIRRK
jgi:hypothetical protein